MLQRKKVRFGIVGLTSTSVDVILFLVLRELGLGITPSNLLSTSAGFSTSFFANKRFTFRDKNDNVKKQLLLYITVTLFGMWIIQPPIIHFIESIIHQHYPQTLMTLVTAKLIAAAITFLWNYFTYSRIVFRQTQQSQ